MPLLDHFHSPIFPLRSWESFHTRWAVSLADALQRQLPRRFFAEVQTHLGTKVEADVAEFEKPIAPEEPSPNGPNTQGGLGVAVQPWVPPAPPFVATAQYPDDFEVQVRDELEDARLAAVIELVSPGNKDRAEARRDFAIKCAAYLQRGIGVIVVDVVTSRRGNMHNELARLLAFGEAVQMPAEVWLYSAAYRPVNRQGRNEFDIWPWELRVDGPLPLLPLALKGTWAVPVDLEATYMDARQRSGL